MGRHKLGQEVQNFALLTEGVSGGRKRIRREFLPELAAWLHMRGREYAHILEKTGGARDRPVDSQLLNTRAYAKNALSVIDTLIRTSGDGFGRAGWYESTEFIAEILGIEVGHELPNIRDGLLLIPQPDLTE